MTIEEILIAIKELTKDDFLQLRVAIRRLCTTDELGKTTVLSADLRVRLAGAKAAAETKSEAASPPSEIRREDVPDTAVEVLRFIIEDSLPLAFTRIFFAIMAIDIEIRRALAKPLIDKMIANSPQLRAENIKPWELEIVATDVMAMWLEKLVPHKSLLTPDVYAHFSLLSEVLKQKLQLHSMVDKAILTVCSFENYVEEAYNKTHQIDLKVNEEKEAKAKAIEGLNKEALQICERKAKLKEKLFQGLPPEEEKVFKERLKKLEGEFEFVNTRIENVSEPFDNKIDALESKLFLARKKFGKQVEDVFRKRLTPEDQDAIVAKIEAKKEPKSRNIFREVSQRSLQFLFGRKPLSRENSPSFGVLPPRAQLNSPSPKGEMFGSPRIASNGSSPRSEDTSPRDPNALTPALPSPVRRLTKQPSALNPNRPPSTEPADMGIPRLNSAPSPGYVAKSPTSPLRGEGLLARRVSSSGKMVDGKEECSPSSVRRPPV